MKFRRIGTAALLAGIVSVSCAEAPAASGPPPTTGPVAVASLAPQSPSVSPHALATAGPDCFFGKIGTLTVCPGVTQIGSTVVISGLNCGESSGPAIMYMGSEAQFGDPTVGPFGGSELGRFPVDSDGRFQASVTLPTSLDPIQGQGGGAVVPGVYAIYSKPTLCRSRVIVTSGPLMAPAEAERLVAARAAAVLDALKTRNGSALVALAHPDKGVRFSPYPYVQVGKDQVLAPSDLATAFADPTIRSWGVSSGSGEEIRATYAAYHERYVYDVDFKSAPQIAYRQTLDRGNIIGNSAALYPDGVTAQFLFPGIDPKFQGTHWRFLDLVFEPVGQTWFLIAVVHGEWTP